MHDTPLDRIRQFAEQAAIGLGLHVLDFSVRGTKRDPVIEVTLDGQRPVLIDDCEKISKTIQSSIAESPLSNLNYRLDVLSPGTDIIITYDYQLIRSVGRKISVIYTDSGVMRTLVGKLVSFSDTSITIDVPRKSGKRGSREKTAISITVDRSSVEILRQVPEI